MLILTGTSCTVFTRAIGHLSVDELCRQHDIFDMFCETEICFIICGELGISRVIIVVEIVSKLHPSIPGHVDGS